MIGFLSHLILDEIWSIEWPGFRPKLKYTFGTAFKFWGHALWSNVLTYVSDDRHDGGRAQRSDLGERARREEAHQIASSLMHHLNAELAADGGSNIPARASCRALLCHELRCACATCFRQAASLARRWSA